MIKKNNEFFLNDLNFMPVYEIKTVKQPSDNVTFDIFKTKVQETANDKFGSNRWDSSMPIDYKKLQKYI